VSAGGDVIGGNQRIEGGYTRTTQQGLQAGDIAKLFESVYSRIEAQPSDRRPQLTDTAKKIEQEAAKGEEANPEQVRTWLGMLGELAPDVLEVAVNALINPGAAVASAVRAVAKGFKVMSAGADELRPS
jgi:hypothetical protein